ncbi:T6SS immunity protein Tli3 family protein [Pantoea sp. C2G6]|uniref:T6SS immunity protein Tli3 family protein n=1 Tax=Pantoea sp. C2G6 TaxID=3243084 RepID=UPI003EDA7D1A
MSPVMRVCFISGMFSLSGCVAGPYGGGVAFVNPFPAMSNQQTKPEKKKQQPVVYGPPQIIYRIDKERYFTLEEYTRCENGKTFYNNKAKGIHTQIAPSSGYLFKGRLFWLSGRDDYLAFPVTANDNKAACMGSDKGCVNIIAVTTDGGKKLRSVNYGSNTQNPNGDTEKYDMLVTNEGFYMIKYYFHERSPTDAYALKWTFSPATETSNPAYPGVTGPIYQPELSFDVSQVTQETMQCDRSLEPKN